jgi:adenylosuccinate synthase
MGVDIVIGAQRGDEGKGNFCSYMGLNGDYNLAIRSASPQAGHSIYLDGKRLGLAHMPCAAVNPNIRLLLGAASFISPSKIFYGGKDYRPHTGETIDIMAEIPTLRLTPERLGIDYRAKIVTEEHKQRERKDERLMGLGSVGSGVNKAKEDLLYKRTDSLPFVTSDPELKKYAVDTIKEMFEAIEEGKNILFETDHGMELCQHFGVFPYTTARTINTSAYLGEIGLPPNLVRDIYLVIKPYVSVVAKDGPLKDEITDENTLEELIGTGGETGSISGRVRRIGKFDFDSFRKAVQISGATKIAISHLDLSDKTWHAIGFDDDVQFMGEIMKECEETYSKPCISLLSYGPTDKNVVMFCDRMTNGVRCKRQ